MWCEVIAGIEKPHQNKFGMQSIPMPNDDALQYITCKFWQLDRDRITYLSILYISADILCRINWITEIVPYYFGYPSWISFNYLFKQFLINDTLCLTIWLSIKAMKSFLVDWIFGTFFLTKRMLLIIDKSNIKILISMVLKK